jgi:decaprenylphospho-beta-D-erythro-pentofuranosid-2-ulose 2-reductase
MSSPSANKVQRIVIVGATSAIAERCARRWAEQGATHFYLLARNQEKLSAIAADLKVRQPQAEIVTAVGEFADPAAIQSQVAEIMTQAADIVLIAHGNLPDQQQCQASLSETAEAIQVNGISPVLIAEAFATLMSQANRGTLAVIGSVAGDRGRKSNYVYGAAKGLVTRYVQGLQHRTAGSGFKVVLVKPGPTDTPMTAHLKQNGAALASVEDVADDIVKGIAKGKPVIYTPSKWALIMMIIRHLPRFIFNRMDI